MRRTIAYLVVTCTILAILLVLVLNSGDGPSGETSRDDTVFEREMAPTEPQASTDEDSDQAAELLIRPATAVHSDGPPQRPPRTEPNILAVIEGEPFPEIESPPWADEMESTILSYIAGHPGLKLTDLQVQCTNAECVIFLGGEDLPVYQMNFDLFATEHGFADAIIRGSDGSDRRIVRLRR